MKDRVVDWGQFYFNADRDWGTSVQVPARFLEIGHLSDVPGGERCWYIEWRLPFRDQWHMWPSRS